jgi:hypothetical protein
MYEPPIESHCARCLRPAPPEDDQSFTDWEALAYDADEVLGVVCPDCITPEEQQAMDEADEEMDEQIRDERQDS